MARNVPGDWDSNNIQKAASEYADNTSGTNSTTASSESEHWDRYIQNLNSGNEAGIRRNMPRVNREMREWFGNEDFRGSARVEDINSQVKRMQEAKRFQLEQIALKKEYIKELEKEPKINREKIKQAREEENFLRAKIQWQDNATKKLLQQRNVEVTAQRERRNAASQFFAEQEKHEVRLGQIQEKRQKTFLYNLGKSNLQFRDALSSYGMQKFRDNAPLGLGGTGYRAGEGASGASRGFGMMGGVLAMAGAAFAGAIIGKLTELFIKSMNQTIAYGDLSKGIHPNSPDGYRLMTMTRDNTMGYGLSTDDALELAKKYRPFYSANGMRDESFNWQLGRGISMGRAFGLDPSTSVEFMGQMFRKSSASGSGDVNRLAFTIGAEIGNGKLAGLEEETLRSIQQLVEMGRKGNVFGADPMMMARLIGSMSGLEGGALKGMRGEDAARVLMNINEALVKPKTTIGTQLKYMAVSQTLSDMGRSDYATDTGMLMRYGSMGIGMTVGGRSSGTALLANMAKLYKRYAPGFADIAFGNETGLPTQLANTFLLHSEEITRGGFAKAAGLDTSKFGASIAASPVGIRFMMAAADMFNKNGGGTSDKEMNKTLVDTLQQLKDNNVEFADKLSAGVDKNADFKTNLEKIAGNAENLKSVNAQDQMREGVQSIDRLLQRLTDAAIPSFQVMIGYLGKIANRWAGAGVDENFVNSQLESGTQGLEGIARKNSIDELSRKIPGTGKTIDEYFQGIEGTNGDLTHMELIKLKKNGKDSQIFNFGANNLTLHTSSRERPNTNGEFDVGSQGAGVIYDLVMQNLDMAKNQSTWKDVFGWKDGKPVFLNGPGRKMIGGKTLSDDNMFAPYNSAWKLEQLSTQFGDPNSQAHKDLAALLSSKASQESQIRGRQPELDFGKFVSQYFGKENDPYLMFAGMHTRHFGWAEGTNRSTLAEIQAQANKEGWDTKRISEEIVKRYTSYMANSPNYVALNNGQPAWKHAKSVEAEALKFIQSINANPTATNLFGEAVRDMRQEFPEGGTRDSNLNHTVTVKMESPDGTKQTLGQSRNTIPLGTDANIQVTPNKNIRWNW